MDTNEKIKAEKRYIKKYRKTYENLPEGCREKAAELIKRAAEFSVQMDECKEHLTEEGLVVEMRQGNYSIERENPWSKIQERALKSLVTCLNKLDGMYPDEKTTQASKAGEVLAAFVAKGKPETR